MSRMSRMLYALPLLAAGLCAALPVLSHPPYPTSPPAQRNLAVEEANRHLVLAFYNRFFNAHQTQEASKVVAENYKQHNPDVPDGKEPFVAFFTQFFKENPASHADIVRSATDHDLVYLHVHSTNGPQDLGQAVVDIFRVRDGKLVEHWDVIQDVPATSANDNTMF